MIRCLYPDCDFNAATFAAEKEPRTKGLTPPSNDQEAAKRQIIDHINNTHDDAHVIIACAHDLTELERFTATTRTPEGAPVEIPQVRFQCSRCGQFEVQSAEPSEDADG